MVAGSTSVQHNRARTMGVKNEGNFLKSVLQTLANVFDEEVGEYEDFCSKSHASLMAFVAVNEAKLFQGCASGETATSACKGSGQKKHIPSYSSQTVHLGQGLVASNKKNAKSTHLRASPSPHHKFNPENLDNELHNLPPQLTIQETQALCSKLTCLVLREELRQRGVTLAKKALKPELVAALAELRVEENAATHRVQAAVAAMSKQKQHQQRNRSLDNSNNSSGIPSTHRQPQSPPMPPPRSIAVVLAAASPMPAGNQNGDVTSDSSGDADRANRAASSSLSSSSSSSSSPGSLVSRSSRSGRTRARSRSSRGSHGSRTGRQSTTSRPNTSPLRVSPLRKDLEDGSDDDNSPVDVDEDGKNSNNMEVEEEAESGDRDEEACKNKRSGGGGKSITQIPPTPPPRPGASTRGFESTTKVYKASSSYSRSYDEEASAILVVGEDKGEEERDEDDDGSGSGDDDGDDDGGDVHDEDVDEQMDTTDDLASTQENETTNKNEVVHPPPLPPRVIDKANETDVGDIAGADAQIDESHPTSGVDGVDNSNSASSSPTSDHESKSNNGDTTNNSSNNSSSNSSNSSNNNNSGDSDFPTSSVAVKSRDISKSTRSSENNSDVASEDQQELHNNATSATISTAPATIAKAATHVPQVQQSNHPINPPSTAGTRADSALSQPSSGTNMNGGTAGANTAGGNLTENVAPVSRWGLARTTPRLGGSANSGPLASSALASSSTSTSSSSSSAQPTLGTARPPIATTSKASTVARNPGTADMPPPSISQPQQPTSASVVAVESEADAAKRGGAAIRATIQHNLKQKRLEQEADAVERAAERHAMTKVTTATTTTTTTNVTASVAAMSLSASQAAAASATGLKFGTGTNRPISKTYSAGSLSMNRPNRPPVMNSRNFLNEHDTKSTTTAALATAASASATCDAKTLADARKAHNDNINNTTSFPPSAAAPAPVGHASPVTKLAALKSSWRQEQNVATTEGGSSGSSRVKQTKNNATSTTAAAVEIKAAPSNIVSGKPGGFQTEYRKTNPSKQVASKAAAKPIVPALAKAQEAKQKQEEVARARRERIEQLRRQHGTANASQITSAVRAKTAAAAATASVGSQPQSSQPQSARAEGGHGGSGGATATPITSSSAGKGGGVLAASTAELSTGGSSRDRADEDNICMTDKESSDSGGSEGEEDYDAEGGASGRPRQKIPRWARGEVLRNALYAQFGGATQVDPESIFGEIGACDLASIFSTSKKAKFKRPRGSSAQWHRDGLTERDRARYRREMGFKSPGRNKSDRDADNEIALNVGRM